jgi:hypothetical protein
MVKGVYIYILVFLINYYKVDEEATLFLETNTKKIPK